MNDVIEKCIELPAPVSRVWRALTDHLEFGRWFGVKLNAPFAAGELSQGRVTHPGYEHLEWKVVVQKIEPVRRFSFSWHPYAVDPQQDYSREKPTLVEFELHPSRRGTLLQVTESGFSQLPPERAAEAFEQNEDGWAAQMTNIESHLAATL